MSFNSLIFVLLFLPVTLAGWYLLNKLEKHEFSVAFLSVASLVFYGYANPKFLILIAVSLLVNFFVSFLLDKLNGSSKKVIYILGVVFNLGLLGYFKYRDFFVETLNRVFKSDYSMKNLFLPLGISFFTLQAIAYITDRYKGEAEFDRFLDFSAFFLYFPKLMSGPVIYRDEFIPQLKNKASFSFENFVKGFVRFILGLAKKVLMADTLGLYVTYSLDAVYYLDMPSSWAFALFYSLELFFDFSGYCDMALGISTMFGITLPENFNEPYKAKTLKEFWKRWHITLTRFLTKYVYIPLGGNRKGEFRKVLNTLLVFFISGLWHGAGWNFVIWGVLHGIVILISGWIHGKKKGNLLSHIITMIFVVFNWVIFRVEDFDILKVVLGRMFSFKFSGFIKDFCTSGVNLAELYPVIKVLEHKNPAILLPFYIGFTVLLLIISFACLCGKTIPQKLVIREKKGYSSMFLLAVAILFVWCVISFSQVTTFLYFKF